MNPNPHIATNIKRYREKLSLTQDTLANYLGVKRVMISYYENGKRPIELEKLEKLADLFNVELSDLLKETTSQIELDMTFAFRSEGLEDTDIKSIGEFQKIVRNYLKMKTILERDVN